MRSVEQQLALVTQSAVAPEPVRIAIAEALGLMCAEEVQASRALPGFDQAAIDGYAVRAVDVGGERGLGRPIDAPIGPIETSLPVVGEVPADRSVRCVCNPNKPCEYIRVRRCPRFLMLLSHWSGQIVVVNE